MKQLQKDFEIIDFHTHPFLGKESNICRHTDFCKMNVEETLKIMDELNVSHFCGSVTRSGGLESDESILAKMYQNNQDALELQRIYKGRYIPGFHVHPQFVKESCEEIEKMSKKGLRLIGEIVPYIDGWEDYSCKEFSEILDVAEQYDMVVSFHSMGEDAMDCMVKQHPKLKLVAAHPGEYAALLRHIERSKFSENYYIDLSGYGIFRYGALRRLIDEVGIDRILFGSDYPTCSVGMYVGGVLLDRTITDTEKEKIFSLNVKKLLRI